VAFDAAFRLDRLRMLLIVGHMRAGSTLLVHLLCSHEEIAGAGELHIHYRRRHDFARAAWQVYRPLGLSALHSSWVLDKVLHDYVDEPALLARCGGRLIVLVRRPQEALPSILDRGLELAPDPRGALEYYKGRLATCRSLFRMHPDALRLSVTYEELVSATRPTLERLERFLRLPSPLRSTYDYLPTTGRRRLGDDSETIWEGRVVERRGRRYRSEVDDDLIAEAERAFQETLEELRG